MNSINFSNGIYDAVTKLFTPAGTTTPYYIYDDACGASALSETDNACNDVACSWGPWVDESPANGGTCLYPCSNYTKKQKAVCNGSWCNLDDGTRGSIKYQNVPCGTLQCAKKTLTAFPEWQASDCSKPCGTGTRTRRRVCNVTPMTKTFASPNVNPGGNVYDVPDFKY